MGKAKWWVCDKCVSLNDVPARKCYKCREPKPADPKLIDDQYAEVGTQKRVGVTVDLNKVGDLTRPDPVETAEGGALMEAFEQSEDPYSDIARQQPPTAQPQSTPRYDPYAGVAEQPETPAQAPVKTEPKPMREPTRRGIDALGRRMWAEGAEVYEPAAAPPPPAAAPPLPPDAPPSPSAPVVQPPMAPPQGAPPPPAAAPPPPQGAVPPPPPEAQGRPPAPPPPPGAVPPPGAAPPPPGMPPPPPGAAPPPSGTPPPPPPAAGTPPPRDTAEGE